MMDELKKEGQTQENQPVDANEQQPEASEATVETEATEAQETESSAAESESSATANETAEQEDTPQKDNEPVVADDQETEEESAGDTNVTRKRIFTGKVSSNKPNKTIIVSIERQVKHPLYKKYYKKTKKVMAHDEENTCNIGDTVRIIEHRPLSAKKRWNLLDVVERAK